MQHPKFTWKCQIRVDKFIFHLKISLSIKSPPQPYHYRFVTLLIFNHLLLKLKHLKEQYDEHPSGT